MQLVIVESPAKASTIAKYLGGDYRVLASFGHVRDLPPKDGSVRPQEDFAMDWAVQSDKTKRIKDIADEAKQAQRLILATDPDREGEAISWHVQEILRAKKALPTKVERVTFNAITQAAVTKAMESPRQLDDDLIDAYRARRALDYLVGFTLSPVLWRRLPGAKSAGRVQSVALRLVVEREREIEAFVTQDYYSISAQFAHEAVDFKAQLISWRGEKLKRLSLTDASEAEAARAEVEAGRFAVARVETKPISRNPPPPFTTSTLQQDAAHKLGFAASHTMRIAQALYEEGAITYMRTDAVQIDPSAISAVREEIGKRYGADYVPNKPRVYRTKAKNAQEAHEAIRPTNTHHAKHGSGDHAKLYALIWKRTMASQMSAARIERTSVDLLDTTKPEAPESPESEAAVLRATGQRVLFDGFLLLYQESRDQNGSSDNTDDKARAQGKAREAKDDRLDSDDSEKSEGSEGSGASNAWLPALVVGDSPRKRSVEMQSHQTQPPPRYSEASLVKKMEELGIGRPSTYASILQLLKDRAYVRVEKKRFVPESSGRILVSFLECFFARYVAYDFTAGLEEQLDDISGGRAQWKAVLAEFWRDFSPRTEEILERPPSDISAALDEFMSPYLFPTKGAQAGDGDDSKAASDPRACPQCADGRLALRGGRYGLFVACSNYPDECKYTRQLGDKAGSGGAGGTQELGDDPDSGLPVTRRDGRFGPYVQLGDGKEAKRASIPKDMLSEMDIELDLSVALRLLSLPREVGLHPESGKMVLAGIGRYGPYLLHAGKYSKLSSTAEVFEIGMNAAVVRIAESLSRGSGGGRSRGRPEPLRSFGAHPVSGGEIKLYSGRYGPYVSDGVTNASLPKSQSPESLTEAEAIALIDARAAKGGSKRKSKAKAAAKTKPAKKPSKSAKK